MCEREVEGRGQVHSSLQVGHPCGPLRESVVHSSSSHKVPPPPVAPPCRCPPPLTEQRNMAPLVAPPPPPSFRSENHSPGLFCLRAANAVAVALFLCLLLYASACNEGKKC